MVDFVGIGGVVEIGYVFGFRHYAFFGASDTFRAAAVRFGACLALCQSTQYIEENIIGEGKITYLNRLLKLRR